MAKEKFNRLFNRSEFFHSKCRRFIKVPCHLSSICRYVPSSCKTMFKVPACSPVHANVEEDLTRCQFAFRYVLDRLKREVRRVTFSAAMNCPTLEYVDCSRVLQQRQGSDKDVHIHSGNAQ